VDPWEKDKWEEIEKGGAYSEKGRSENNKGMKSDLKGVELS